jgi:hypothetical protein
MLLDRLLVGERRLVEQFAWLAFDCHQVFSRPRVVDSTRQRSHQWAGQRSACCRWGRLTRKDCIPSSRRCRPARRILQIVHYYGEVQRVKLDAGSTGQQRFGPARWLNSGPICLDSGRKNQRLARPHRIVDFRDDCASSHVGNLVQTVQERHNQPSFV